MLIITVDMEWLEGSGGMVVDIGLMPEMALTITSPSVPASKVNEEEQLPAKAFDVSSIDWRDEMKESEAHRIMEKHMFPFKKVASQLNRCMIN